MDGGITIPETGQPSKAFDNRIEGTYTRTAIITWPQYFDVFQYQWLEGNARALNEPFNVVLTENRARKYFGNIPLKDMIGKTVVYRDSLNVHVAGIVKDWQGNTDLGFTDFISISTATHSFLKTQLPTEDWSNLHMHGSMAFVKLAKGITATEINNRFEHFIKKNVKLDVPGSKLHMWLQPLTDMHFTKDFHRGDDGDNFRKPYLPTLYALMGVALFILILAIVNFINLSTAQSIQRAKEIGVRKVLGSKKINIRAQFLTETCMLTLIAVIVSAILVQPIIHVFEDYIPAGVKFHLLNWPTIIFLTAITVVTSLLAGFYPARVLASYLPVLSLKGTALHHGTEKMSLRKVLIVFQFSISLIFIICSIVIGRQISYMNRTDKGFNTDAIITFYNWNDHEGKMAVLANKIKQLPGVDKVLLQGTSPMGFAQNIDGFSYKGDEGKVLEVSAQIGNEDFIPFYQMKLIAGRNMLHSDSLQELVVNETLTKAIGCKRPQEAVGKFLYQPLPGGKTGKAFPIVGVVADFHITSFHDAIQPAVIENVPDRKSSIAFKLATSEKNIKDVKQILSKAEGEWKKLFPEKSFDYSFLNESISRLFEQEQKTAWLSNMAMGLTIFISCMGLFGLGLFNTQMRTKEIGIRKVLGASVTSIVAMLNKDIVLLIIIALTIASPVAWYFMNEWLQDFVYRTTISWWIFASAGIFALLVAFLTVSFQAIKAGLQNPLKSLRTE